jgi:hypothetical protein
VLEAATAASSALDQLLAAHGHCLLVEQDDWVIALVTLADLQRAITSDDPAGLSLAACRRSDLVWLPSQANLAQLEDQLSPNGLRQLPVFDLGTPAQALLPEGVPRGGLPLQPYGAWPAEMAWPGPWPAVAARPWIRPQCQLTRPFLEPQKAPDPPEPGAKGTGSGLPSH